MRLRQVMGENSLIYLYSTKHISFQMTNMPFFTMFAIIITTLGAVAFAGLTIITSAIAQEDNATMAGNLTMGAANMTGTNMTNGTGNISGVEDPF